ncbi:WXG100 family type VII secretion target [Nocardioides antri]|uniref:WXG100 family type VII secretion target n=1 Tax=Nocardioides antri TaxID=2607659 RepID=A0A5B1M5Y9_9ACTN|nr:WXG100 family type VII secretion target [Nocardioides antri]KAA1427197.1 WXG100 family type VII secretion target [Nocardioides antri]
MGHYQLDVDPGPLRQVKRRYAAAAELLGQRATKVRSTPDEIGDSWLGSAATSVKTDMGTVATMLVAFQGHLETASEALGTLAKVYDDALDTLGRLNRRRAEAEADCQAELTSLDRKFEQDRDGLTDGGRRSSRWEHEELADVYSGKRSAATGERDRVFGNLDTRYEELVEECRTATSTCARALENAVYVTVPKDIKLNLSDPRAAQGAYLAMYDAAEEALGDELILLQDLDALDDGQKIEDRDRVAEMIYNYSNFPPEDREELLEILERHQGDPEFAGLLANGVDVQHLANALGLAHDGPWADGTDIEDSDAYNQRLMKALGPLLGLGTMVQGDYRLPDDKVDEWYDAITGGYQPGTMDVAAGSQTLMASLLGQGGWDPEFLSELSARVIEFERDELEGADGWWHHTGSSGVFTLDGYYLDPVQALATALSRNRAAAQTLLTEGGTRTLGLEGEDIEVSDVLAYLLLEREWLGANGEPAIGALLTTALSEKPGDLVPAELARQLQGVVAYGEEQAAKAKEEAEKNDKPWYVDLGHLVLDLGGLIPLVGEIADLINAGWYELEGDHVNAGLSAAGAIPFAGWAATGGKLTLKGLKGVVSPELYAKLSKQIEALGDRASYNVQYLNGQELVHIDFQHADDLAAALKAPQPNTIYQSGDLIFYTDAKGVITVGGKGGMRRFMALGDHFKHLPPATELRYGGHTFRLGDDGALEVVAINRWKPIWGHGEAFNAQNWHRYSYNEIHLANGKRLDSYDPGDWIVERKYRQYAALKNPGQLANDIALIRRQYPPGLTVPRTPGNLQHFPGLFDGAGPGVLAGKNVLEIPPQNGPLDIAALRDAMNGRPPVVIRDTDGKIYTPKYPSGR